MIIAQDAPKYPPKTSELPQDGANIAQDCPKVAPSGPKVLPLYPQDGTNFAQDTYPTGFMVGGLLFKV